LQGKAVDYAAPVMEQVAKFWYEVVTGLAEPIEFGIYIKRESDKIIIEPGTEHYIHCRTAWNPDTLRGGSTDLLIFDEFQMMHEETWAAAGAPRLIDRNGDAVFIYTPPSLRMRARTQAGDPLHAAKMFKKHLNDPEWLCLHFTTMDNPFVSKEGIDEVAGDLTQLAYRQEILAEDIEEVPGALWKQALIDKLRVKEVPPEALPLVRIVIGIDPSGSSTNEAGVVAAAKGRDGHGYILNDDSLLAATPRAWGQAAVRRYHALKADRIVGERNYGGDMVREVIMTVDALVSYRDVTATRGKQVRAEPIFALYEKGTIYHVGDFDRLEEEQCSYVPEVTRKSPNRMDALVWALTELFPEEIRLSVWENL
jgi:Terminase RNaseH-like domain